MKRPTKITPDPIIDAVVELRFENKVPSDAVLGMLFSVVRDDFPKFIKLPIADIPEEIRKKDNNLKYAPNYQSISSPFLLNVGPNVISISNPEKYVGWKENFFPFIKNIINKIEQTDIVESFTRIGLRYIDYFECNIFDNITLQLTIDNKPLNSPQTTISTIFKQDSYFTRVQIQNNTTVNIGNKQGRGSIIDTDTFFEPSQSITFGEIVNAIDMQHELSLEIFFKLLRPKFLDSLNPEY